MHDSDRKPAITERAFSASDQVGQEDADVSWSANSKDGADDAADRPKKGEGDVILESMLFKDDAKEIGVVEARHTAVLSVVWFGVLPLVKFLCRR